jgi:hypothetical protein
MGTDILDLFPCRDCRLLPKLLLAEFVGPPPMRQQAEPSSAMIANLRLPHFTLAQHFVSNKRFDENPSNAK